MVRVCRANLLLATFQQLGGVVVYYAFQDKNTETTYHED